VPIFRIWPQRVSSTSTSCSEAQISLPSRTGHQSTHHVNCKTLSKMKRGALLIKAARGSLVDTEALDWALNTGIVVGAGLDVLEE
jgi:lactate dehydrogenase-like 2-hydroxyacid dehydrogenase